MNKYYDNLTTQFAHKKLLQKMIGKGRIPRTVLIYQKHQNKGLTGCAYATVDPFLTNIPNGLLNIILVIQGEDYTKQKKVKGLADKAFN